MIRQTAVVGGGSVEAYGRVGNGGITTATTIRLFFLPDSTPSAMKGDDHIASGGRGCYWEI